MGIPEEDSAAAEEFRQRGSAEAAESTVDPLMRQRANLLGHCETPLGEPSLGWNDFQVQGVGEISAREWHRQ